MRLGQRKEQLTDAERLLKRVQSLDTVELIQWAETCIVGIGRAFGDWQYAANPAIDSLGEAQLGVEALSVVLEDLRRRTAR